MGTQKWVSIYFMFLIIKNIYIVWNNFKKAVPLQPKT